MSASELQVLTEQSRRYYEFMCGDLTLYRNLDDIEVDRQATLLLAEYQHAEYESFLMRPVPDYTAGL